MVVTYSIDQQAVKIKIKATDCTDDTAFDVSDVASQKIIFYKPDGTEIEKDAIMVEDTANSGEFFIQYTILSTDTILNLAGELEYTAQITFTSGDIATLSQNRVAWVV